MGVGFFLLLFFSGTFCFVFICFVCCCFGDLLLLLLGVKTLFVVDDNVVDAVC